MKNIEIVLENLKLKGIEPDEVQQSFLKNFIEIDSKYKPPILFRKQKNLGSFYLWGPVGRGKTELLKAINECYFKNAGIFHFIEFMQLIHASLSEISKTKDPLLLIAEDISKKYQILFIDEFQIEDISDAMIIGLVLDYLIKNGVRIMLSSNAPPEDLYKDGLQRNKFLPTIQLIQSQFYITSLQGEEDYRLRKISSFSNALDDVEKFLHKTFQEDWVQSNNFTINNRVFSCKGHSHKFLWISFKDFFSEPCGSKDFIEICKTYDWLFINEFHSCDDDSLDIIRRFISFLDIAYQEKQKIKFFAESTLLANIYTGSQLNLLWERASSRLHEMSNKKYLKDFEKN